MNDLKNVYYSELFFFIKPTYICFMSKSGLNCVTRVAMEKYSVQSSHLILFTPFKKNKKGPT